VKIIYFIQHFPPFPGGAALKAKTISDALVRKFGRENLCLTVLTSVRGDECSEYEVIGLLNKHIRSTESIAFRILGELKFGLLGAYYVAFHRPDKLLVSCPAYISAAVISIFAIFLRIPYILEIRDIYPEVYRDAGILSEKGIIFRVLSQLTKIIYRKADQIITISEQFKNDIQELRKSRVNYVYNGYPNLFQTIRPEKFQEFTVCFHGNLGYLQDIETLSKVAEKLSLLGVNVITIGSGRKENLVKANPSFKHFGRLPLESMAETVAKCHVGLSPRTDEQSSRGSFPLKVFEYLGLGMPVVLTPPSEAGDFLKKHGCGVVCETGDVDGIVSAIIRLRDDKINYARMALAAEKASRGLSREELANKFVEIAFNAT